MRGASTAAAPSRRAARALASLLLLVHAVPGDLYFQNGNCYPVPLNLGVRNLFFKFCKNSQLKVVLGFRRDFGLGLLSSTGIVETLGKELLHFQYVE